MAFRLTVILGSILLVFTTPAISQQGMDLETFNVSPGIHFPFPEQPESLGDFRSGEFLEEAWRADKENMGFTATVTKQAPDAPDSVTERQVLFSYSTKIAEGMGGEILSREMTSVSGLPALILDVKLSHSGLEARNRTLLLNQNNSVHTWALQYVVAENEALAETVFQSAIEMIRIR